MVDEQLDAGDLVWADFDPRIGREQSGRRPALVLSDKAYHAVTNMAIICPITTTPKPWPTRVNLPDGLPITGQVMVDHIKSVDRDARYLKPAGRASRELLAEVRSTLALLLRLSPEDAG